MKKLFLASLLLNGYFVGTITAQVPGHTRASMPDEMNASKRLHDAKAEIAPSPRYFATPLSFEVNNGQTDKRAKFLARGHGYELFLTELGAVFAFHDRSAAAIGSHRIPHAEDSSFSMSFLGANKTPHIAGAHLLKGQSNYLIGSDSKQWQTHIPNYSEVRYSNLYPGVDLLYHGNGRNIEYDLRIAPGASVEQIVAILKGSTDVHLGTGGQLKFRCGMRQITLEKPAIYQLSATGSRIHVGGYWYMRDGDKLGFEIPDYDHSRELVIDPTLNFGLSSFPFATYLGGSGIDVGNGIAVDSKGSIYVTGETSSTDFPTTKGTLQPTDPNNVNGTMGESAFVSKYNSSGTLIYSTYLGGSTDSQGGNPTTFGNAIAVNSSGNAFVTGFTSAHGSIPPNSTSFPTKPASTGCGTPITPTNCSDAFITELSADGASLVYSQFIVGLMGRALALDPSGNAYVTGTSESGSPLASSIQPAYGGGLSDAFVTKIDTSGNITWWTYLGGSGVDEGFGIALDHLGNVYVIGSTAGAFPLANPLQSSFGGGNEDAFVAEINNAGNKLVYSTYLGGSGDDAGFAIAVDSDGTAFVTGSTQSTNFPNANALQLSLGGSVDAFITKIAPNGTKILFSTFLGGAGPDAGRGITLDANDDVYVTGQVGSATTEVCVSGCDTTSPTNLPTIVPIDPNLLNLQNNSIQPQCGNTSSCANAFVTEISSMGNQFLYFTYLGGSGVDAGNAIALDSSANCSQPSNFFTPPLGSPCAYVTGDTTSSDFPVSDTSALTGTQNAFVAQVPSIVVPVCNKSLNQVGLQATVGLTCTQDFVGGQGNINWGDKTAYSAISLNGLNTNTTATHTYAGTTAVPSVSMTNTAGTDTTYATPFPVTQFMPIGVTVTVPSGSTVQEPGTLQLSATVLNATLTGATWSVSPAGEGTIADCPNFTSPIGPATPGEETACGVYTPPSGLTAPVTVYVIATALADKMTSNVTTATPLGFPLTVNPPIRLGLALSPNTNTVQAGTANAITVTAQVSPWATSQKVTWQLTGTGCNGGPCGSLSTLGPSASVVYTPPAELPSSTPIEDTVTATTVAQPTQVASSTITVTPLPINISISPTSAAVIAAQSKPLQFTATVTGPSNTNVVWSISGNGCSNAPCGSLSATGLYTPPSVVIANPPQIDTVTATSQADASKVVSAQVTIYNPSSVSITPGTQSVQAGSAPFKLTAQVSGYVSTQNVLWQLAGTGCNGSACGSISTAGPSTFTVYTPPAKLPSSASITDTLTATSVAVPTQSGHSQITVNPLPISISINPTSATVVATQSRPIQFTATVTGPSNTNVVWSLSGNGCSNSPCGSLSAAGLYIPPSAAIANPSQTDTVTATSQADTTKAASAQVTINNPVVISINPSGTFAVQVANSIPFIATVTGSSNNGVLWSVSGTGCDGGPCGTISTFGTYTAPATLASSQTDTITATALADQTKTATAKAVIFLPAVAPAPASSSVAPGQAAQYTVTLSPGTGDPLNSTAVSCSNLPNGASCQFSPSILPAGGTSFTVKVTTTAPTTSSVRPQTTPMLAALIPFIGLFLFGLRGGEFRKKLLRYSSLLILSILMASGLIACGTGGSFGANQLPSPLATPAGNYTIDVIGTPQVPTGQASPFTVTTLQLDVN